MFLFNPVVLNVSAMWQGDVFLYLLSSKEPTTIKALGILFTQCTQEKGESDELSNKKKEEEPLPVLIVLISMFSSLLWPCELMMCNVLY